MKKLSILIICFLLIFTGCQQEGKEKEQESATTGEEQGQVVSKEEGITGIFPERDELVIDGDYVDKLSDLERKEAENNGVNFKNYTLPMINLDTPYAHYLNFLIQKNILIDCIHNVDPEQSWQGSESSKEQFVDYEYTLKNDILSILITNARMDKASGEEQRMYYCFNLDIKTGEEIRFKEALSRLNYPENIKPQFERRIREAIEGIVAESDSDDPYMTVGRMTANCIMESNSLFLHQEDQGTNFRFFINEEGFIGLPIPLTYYFEEEMITLSKDEEEEEINPTFTLLNIPEDKAYGNYYLGDAYDEDVALVGVTNLIGIYRDLNTTGSPDLLLPSNYLGMSGGGSELYWIVPKYRNALIRVYGQYLDEEGEMQIDPVALEYTVGDVLVFCNSSDLYSNVVIEIEQNGEIFRFSPGLSLKDGSNMVEPEGEDLEDYIDTIDNLPKEKDEAVQRIMERLREFLPKG
ncbi:MAG: hypothetical protein Q4D95_06370 [Peptoniphilus sp.]|nr:hypothetical protein [Peptoniphilus sp.]